MSRLKKIFLIKFKKFTSPWIVLGIDLLFVLLSYEIALLIKHTFNLKISLRDFVFQIGLVLFVYALVFLLTKSYRGVIRYTNSNDMSRVGISILVATLVLWLIDSLILNRIPELHNSKYDLKRSTLLIHMFINLNLLISSRIIYAYLFFRLRGANTHKKNILIYGAGQMGAAVKNLFQRDEHISLLNVVAFIDDNKRKRGKLLLGKKILHIDGVNENWVQKNEIKEVYIAINKLRTSRLNQIIQKFLDLDVKPKLIPPIKKWVNGELDLNQIKDVKIEDLLARNTIELDRELWDNELKGKTILVTGGAGSIGSEIIRQLSKFKVKSIIVLDQSESGIYDIGQELLSEDFDLLISVVGSVCDKKSCEEIFNKHHPEIIFHAAAYKHVPLMELYPKQAIKVNLGGAKNIADLSIKYNAERFVMVSTDKAVNPTNIMGATKRAAEIYIGVLSLSNTNTKFMTTRFGNVLGSNGSVIPLFKSQIKKGGPLTLTHKEIIRYFMTIPEASQLVIEAGITGSGGEIFVFDMGKPIKIFELAKNMIRLSGLNYPKDIDIKITGLRPGEKLYEELLSDKENTLPTHHKKINIAKINIEDSKDASDLINNLLYTIEENDIINIVSDLKKLVPEFKSKNSNFSKLD